jgi:hypothetical protein
MAEAATQSVPEMYQLVDSIPEVYAARQAERNVAEELLAWRRENLVNGVASVESLQPVDALSTADKVLEAKQNYGKGSAPHIERYQGLVQDCQRLVAEWYRKKTSEYFPQVRHVFDSGSQEFFSHGLSVRQMTENALVPISDDPEEEARRINERVEDATPQILRSLGCVAMGDAAIRTVSECTDKAIEDYATDIRLGRKHRGYGGYVPEIEKVMIRDIRLDTSTKDRFEEQIGLPGTYITHYIIQKTLERKGAVVGGMGKTELHAAQIIATDDLMEFAELLDTVASEEWCTTIFMGEQVPAGHTRDYATFRQEALKRQDGLKDLAETVALFVLDLAADKVDRRRAPLMVEEFVKLQLLKLGKEDVSVAEQMFDAVTAKGLQEVVALERAGRQEEAFTRMQEVIEQAPGGGFCGAGSCGLEAVNLAGEEGESLAKKLGVEPGDTVLRDKDRACPNCNKKKIIYAFNKTRVVKYCEGCEKHVTEKAK